MSDDSDSPNRGDIKSSLNELVGRILSEYPRLTLPVAVVFGLLGLATIGKTVVELFVWAYREWHGPGLILAALAVVAVSAAAISLVRFAISPRPKILELPAHYLSRSPRVRWEYPDDPFRSASYEVLIKLPGTEELKRINVPERMRQIGLPGLTGRVEVSVDALVDGKKVGSSRPARTEIYRDSLERIRDTKKLRVAVHADPGEEIFCFYQDGQWQGFDIELSRLIASELSHDQGMECAIDVVPFFYQWPAVISAPNEHEVDMAIASVSITKDRVNEYGINFSKPYAVSGLGVIGYERVFADRKPGDSIRLKALKGQVIAVHRETMAAKFVDKIKEDPRYRDIQVLSAADNDELRELLRDNTVSAVIHDYQRAFTLLEAGTIVCALDHGTEVEKDQYGIVFSRLNIALLRSVDAIIERNRPKLTEMLDRFIERKRQMIAAEGPQSGATNAKLWKGNVG